jgi:hypothetical protein
MIAIVYPVALFGFQVPSTPLLWGCLAFCLLFPVWFFRYARSLWLAFDQLFDPRQPGD